MPRSLAAGLVLLITAVDACAELPPTEMVQKLTSVIREKCPDAEFVATKDGFTAKSMTMMFTIHRRSKTGEIFSQTDQHEGPTYKGFILQVSAHPGQYMGAAATPQTLQGPYFPTYIDAVPLNPGDGHYYVRFSYGSRLDADLKKAIWEAIPRTKFQADAAVQEAPKPMN